jgi:hypothetical protein
VYAIEHVDPHLSLLQPVLSLLLICIALANALEVEPQVAVSRRPAVPIDPITGVLDSFRTHTVVALGEGSHGNEQAHRFRLALIRDPRFSTTVNDIVVESGSARYQDVIDRFVRGENVPADVLARAWRDTTQPHDIWDLPIYEEMFRAVRDVNAALPREHQLRVLLGDPPVEWENVRTLDDLNKWGHRDSYAADVVRREVIAKQRRALLVYGDDHFAKRSRASGAGDEWPANLVGQLEQSGTRVFVIHTETRMDLAALQPDVRSWSNPSLALLEGTTLGGAEYEPTPRLRSRRIEELFDAVLYLGSPSEISFSRIDPRLCADAAYMQMRLARLALLPGPPPQAPPGTLGPLDRFKQACAGLTAR